MLAQSELEALVKGNSIRRRIFLDKSVVRGTTVCSFITVGGGASAEEVDCLHHVLYCSTEQGSSKALCELDHRFSGINFKMSGTVIAQL